MLSRYLSQPATVEDYLGSGAYGATFGPPREISCWIEEGRKVVRDNDGNEVLSDTTLICSPDVDVPVESKVSVGGRTSFVIATATHRRPSGPHHTEINLR